MEKPKSIKKMVELETKRKCLLIGGSAGSSSYIRQILQGINNDGYPVIIVVHIPPQVEISLAKTLAVNLKSNIIDATDKAYIQPGYIYIAPGGYHLYIEKEQFFSLSLDEKVHYCRPSIDVLFTSAADVYKNACVGVLLSGANQDGAEGLQRISALGGTTLVQSPDEADVSTMPQAAIDTGMINAIAKTTNLITKINELMV